MGKKPINEFPTFPLEKGKVYQFNDELLTFQYCHPRGGRTPIYAFINQRNKHRWLRSQDNISKLVRCETFCYKCTWVVLVPQFADGGNGSGQAVSGEPIYYQLRWIEEGNDFVKEPFLSTEIAIAAFKHYLDNGFFDMTIDDKSGKSIIKERFANHV